jgi:Ulp1 family protease
MIIQCWTEQFGRFQRQDPPSVQIHHTGKSHWVTSLQDKKDGTVYVLDSYSKTFTLTPSLEIQLSAIYGQGKTNLLIKPEVQQQTNGYNCGVYALANLVEFCYNGTYNTHITLRGI